MAPTKARSTKKAAKHSKDTTSEAILKKQESNPLIPLELQQSLLNIFKNAFSERLELNIQALLQEVKGHLFNRDFVAAFGRQEYLDAYALRWSPSRTLGYIQTLAALKDEHLLRLSEDESSRTKVVCLGGGAGAEIVAFAGLLNLTRPSDNTDARAGQLDVVAIDMADWSSVVKKLSQNITNAPPLSNYASARSQAANTALSSSDSFNVSFHQHDILATDFSILQPLIAGGSLVTVMFTLNELYSTSLALTQKFLLNLTGSLVKGAQLLIIDSPGSYSTVSLNGAEKNYPMHWLLNHTLLRSDREDEPVFWEKIAEEESKWFRLDAALRYPIELENMRYQLHLFKKLR